MVVTRRKRVDRNTGTVPDVLKEFYVLERCGLRIGIIGLVEKYAHFLVFNRILIWPSRTGSGLAL